MEMAVLLLGAGLLAGTMNAVAGGGSFITMPALLLAGVPSVAANASSTVALFPGSVVSAWVCRSDVRDLAGVGMPALVATSLVGGLLGALLLLATPSATFDVLVPWLLLVGTVAFALGRPIGAALRRRVTVSPPTCLYGQLVLAIYGGYFGGAVGIMMMALWSVLDVSDLHAANAAKALLVGATNAVAVICFVIAGTVCWPQTIAILAGVVVGGYGGARLARRLPAERLRVGMIVFNVSLTTAFFVRAGL
jgi:uncharacterized protein